MTRSADAAAIAALKTFSERVDAYWKTKLDRKQAINARDLTLILQRIVDNVGPTQFWIGLSKAPVMAFVIAIIGCHYGLRVLPNTESLGRGTTASVVTSITMVILVNSVFALVFRDVGI